ncbi:MAG: Uma2 family endonuclease [Labilithrix sp.]|nr:Uma2 family endonuclease [Labilithrix sp.]
MAASTAYAPMTVVPRIAVKLPLVVPEPDGFVAARYETWPKVVGRLEYVGGRLEYMPPCGKNQQRVAVDVATELNLWRRDHVDFVVGANEAGMLLDGEVRAADAAVWRAGEPSNNELARTPPVLAVEICGEDESLETLLEKAAWYLERGAEAVWTVVPETRSVHVTTSAGTVEVTGRIPETPSLPDLSPLVADFFRQI